MSVTSDPYTGTDLVAVISETWTGIVNEKTFNDTVFANFCTDLSSYATEGSDIFHVPDFYTNALTVGTQSTQGAEITTVSSATVDTYLTIDTHKDLCVKKYLNCWKSPLWIISSQALAF